MQQNNDRQDKSQGVGLPPGTKVGKYEIAERTNIGGQAIIYKAHDPLLDRAVAIKQISSHLAEDPKFLELFRKEAQILARLGSQHSEIVGIHELIEDERGLFIVMEYVEGNSLEVIIDDTAGPVEPRAVLQILWRLAAGLHAVHNAGIIHRDIKPANIIIAQGLRPKIADFGVAASASGQTSMVLGTTKYMAPELFSGEQVDGRADMYSLGFIAYEMLIGRPKFREIFADVVRDPHSESLRWMKWHGNDRVEAPAASEVNPDVPAALSDIVAKMIAKDPDRRFADMEELGRTIKVSFSPKARAAAGAAGGGAKQQRTRQPVEKLAARSGVEPDDEGDRLEVSPDRGGAEPPPTAPLPKRKLSLRTKLILAGVAAAAVIAIGVIIGIQEYRQSQRQSQTAQELFVEAKELFENRRYAEARQKFEQVLAEHRGTDESAQAYVYIPFAQAHQAVLDDDWELAQHAQKETAERLGEVQAERPGLLEWTRTMNQEIENFSRYRNTAWTFASAMDKARTSMEQRDFVEARTILRRELRDVALDRQQTDRLDALGEQIDRAEILARYDERIAEARDYAERDEYDRALAAYGDAKSILEGSAGDVVDEEKRRQMLSSLREARDALQVEQTYTEAMSAAEEARQAEDKSAELAALAEAVEVRPSEDLRERMRTLRAEIAYNAAVAARQKGDLAKAREAVRESLRHKELPAATRLLAELEQTSRRAELIDQGDAAMQAGNHADALQKYEKALAIEPDESLRAKIADARFEIAMAEAARLRKAGEYEDAIAAYERARQLNPSEAGTIDSILSTIAQQREYESLLGRGDAALEDRSWSRALDFYNRAKAIRDNAEVAGRIATTRYRMNLLEGERALSREDYSGALGYFKLARGFKDTEEVRNLIAEAQEALERQNEEE